MESGNDCRHCNNMCLDSDINGESTVHPNLQNTLEDTIPGVTLITISLPILWSWTTTWELSDLWEIIAMYAGYTEKLLSRFIWSRN